MPSILDRQARVVLAEIDEVLTPVDGVADPAFVRGLEGMDRNAARKAIVAELERLGLLERTEPYTHQVPHGDRGGVPIEPLLTTQWYCNAEVLAKPAIEAVETGKTVFVPKQWENTFFAWMREIQPWCISRQLWWGHRIPAWYGPDGAIFVATYRSRGQGGGARAIRPRRSAGPGRGRAGYVVQFGAVAVLDAGLAGADQGAGAVLSGRCAGHRLRHHLLLGRADDDAGHPLHGRGAVPHGVHPWPGARRARPEDVEVEGQQHRPAGADRPLRRRCAALHHLRADRSRAGREAGCGARRELSAASSPSCGMRRGSAR